MPSKKEKKPKDDSTLGVKRTTEEVDMDRIRVPDENPARVGCNRAVVDQYRDIIAEYISDRKKHERSGDSASAPKFPFPPVKVKRIEPDDEGCDLEVIGGCHTFMAATEAGLGTIEVEICEGTEKDLLILAIQDNACRGLSYNRRDMRYNILNLGKVKPKPTIYQIADILGCSKSHVSNVLNDKDGQEEEKSTDGQAKRPAKEFDRKRFTKNLLGRLEGHIGNFVDVDVIALAKIAGLIAKLLDEKQPDLVDTYCDAVRYVVSLESMDQIDYETDMLFLSDEKIAAMEAEQEALCAVMETEAEPEDEPEDEA